MSNTATLRTDRPAGTIRLTADTLRLVLATAVLALIWISLDPFSAGGLYEGGESSFSRQGRLINQLGYSVMAALTLATIVSCVDRRVLVRFISVPWLIMAAIIAASAVTADVSGTWRSVAFTLIALVMAAALPLLPARRGDFETALKTVSLALLGLCYAGLVLDPGAAMHQASDLEAQHAGLWRGVFTHKNIAGPVMVMVGFGGIFLARRGHWIGGTLIAVLAFFFAFNAGSKTALALAPVTIALVLLPALFGQRLLAAIAALVAIAAAHALTVGTVFVPAFDAILRIFHETTTFTGRTAIWDSAGDYMLARPWTGFGLDGFWGTEFLLSTEQPFDRSWDPRGIVHGHNGFVDIALFLGLPGLAMTIWLIVLAPAADYVRAGARTRDGALADLFFMVIVFAVLVSALESFFFRRADPIWLTTVIALAGLHLTARLPLRT
ncbi:MAG: O-antigen ligase family protein [Roseitalea sp.]|jgi:O-antigen ligase|nr:O-antigen ligase family protein [Roseitalea sp.]MBO6722715.1 O-antigen ligase family protein [Roseitalea sp.]MBO6744490.1 O-antigen ligase family protein [Roseitalea sp.]